MAEATAVDRLRQLLKAIPWVSDISVELESQQSDRWFDVMASFVANGRRRHLLCEVKSDGQPRHIRNAVNQLKRHVVQGGEAATMVIAPYLSEEARTICVDAEVGYLDFEGNCRLVFDGIYIERSVPTRPAVVRRDLRSIFKPKAAQILRALLRMPDRSWKVVELADVAGVSLGQVSNVRKALVDREWAEVDVEGLRLTSPAALLGEWRDKYEPPPGHHEAYYTALHGAELEQMLRAFVRDNPDKVMLAGFTAAKFLAPFGRSGTSHVYAGEEVVEDLSRKLKLSRVSTGGNFVIARPQDDGLFLDRWMVAADIVTTSPVQTYLDLYSLGERGQEAAEHLRQEMIPWSL